MARRNRSNDLSMFADSICTLPSITSRPASKSTRMASVCKRSWKATGVELASPLVHHAGDEISEALLGFRVLGGAAAEGKAHGDQGIGVALDQPSLDAAGARDALDVHGVSRGCGKRREERECGGKPKALPGERAQNPPLTHGV